MESPRFVVLPEDLQHVHSYEMKIENENITDAAAIVTPKRNFYYFSH